MHDGQPKPGTPFVGIDAGIEAAELLKDHFALVVGNADAGIPHFNAQVVSLATAAEQHAATGGVVHGVGKEVLQRATQQGGVAAHPGAGLDEVEPQLA